MNYDVEFFARNMLEKPNAIRITSKDQFYEQIKFPNNLIATIYKEGPIGDGAPYKGTLYGLLKNTEKDYTAFKSIIDALSIIDRREIKSSREDYMRYLDEKELEINLWDIGCATLKINMHDNFSFSEKLNELPGEIFRLFRTYGIAK